MKRDEVLHSLIQNEIEDKSSLVEIAFGSINQGMNNYIFENTFWDDMVNFIDKPSKTWANDYIYASMGKYDINYAWFFDSELNQTYFVTTENEPSLEVFPMTKSYLNSIISKKWFNEFYFVDNNDVIGILTAPVQPSKDYKRVTKPVGYMICGKRWNKSNLKKVSTLLAAETRTIFVSEFHKAIENSKKNKYEIYSYKELKDWEGKPVAYFYTSFQNNTLKEIDSSTKNQYSIITIFAIALILVVALGLYFGVVKPLYVLTKSIESGEIQALSSIEKQKSEFSSLAGLIKKFFEQKTILIEQRNELESFSYTVSHDLRSPIRAIKGFTQILNEELSGKLNHQEVELFGRILKATGKMEKLIENLLELSQVVRKKLRISKFDFTEMCVEILNELKDGNPNRKVVSEIQSDIYMIGDKDLIQIALVNIIGNAWKYSSNKEVTEIKIGSTLNNGKTIYFVQDNGAGFDMKNSANLFNEFTRLHSDSEFSGTGLGLSIVKRIIKRHSGEVWALSELGKGSTFYFTIGV